MNQPFKVPSYNIDSEQTILCRIVVVFSQIQVKMKSIFKRNLMLLYCFGVMPKGFTKLIYDLFRFKEI